MPKPNDLANGHRKPDIRTTMSLYTHAVPAALRESKQQSV
jgi:hypothetical protein